ITLLGGVSVIVGSMVGSGIFISPVGVLSNVGMVGASLLIWVACGLIATCGSLTYAELGTMIPQSGAEYPYLKEAFGPVPAFLFAWTSSIVLKPSAVAIIGLVFGEYLIRPFFENCQDVPSNAVKLAAATCICLVTCINCISVKVAERIQICFTIAKLTALLIIVVAGLYALSTGLTDNLQNSFTGEVKWSTVGTSFYQGFWAYDGWNQLNYITEELKNPSVNLPRAIMIGIPLVMLVYVLTNVAYLAGLSLNEMMSSRAVAVTFGGKLLGSMAWIIPLGVAISTFGSINGYIITGPRIIYTAAREGHMPEVLAMMHTKRFTPVPAVIFNFVPTLFCFYIKLHDCATIELPLFVSVIENKANDMSRAIMKKTLTILTLPGDTKTIIALLVLIPNDFDSLVNYFSFSMWLFHGGSALALLVLRWKQPDRKRPYKVPIFIPVIVVLIALYLVIYPIVSQPAWEYLYAALFIASGILFYIPFIHLKINATCMRPATVFLQKLLQVIQPDNC
uniref:b(0,+)-type amino acid transporter 1 n=1 Tax=Ciona savignyi TaxID=51511 RepID=H2YIK5_CIOSA